MKGVWNLGRIANIKIQVHWTFALLLLWIIFSELQRGGTLASTLFSMSLILVLFLCVVLHELGHALTAKKFNIRTQKITLLPIGGVASLEKMPEKPREELLVALAGPAVNVLIAILLFLLIPVQSYLSIAPLELLESLRETSPRTFLFYLFIANVMLVIFNLIPAFPMDGGRVLRALLAYRMDRTKATDIAATIGQMLAVVFFIFGFLFNPFLILIALFIFIGAYGENKMVQQISLLEGHTIKDAMLTNITIRTPENTVQDMIDLLLAGTEKDFIIVENEKIVGIVYYKDIIGQTHNNSLLVRDIMNTSFQTVDVSKELKEIFDLIAKERKSFFPVTNDQKLVGAIDKTNLSEFILLKSNLISK
ncbi:MAG: site-2 protease family protein [Saonia sp.]